MQLATGAQLHAEVLLWQVDSLYTVWAKRWYCIDILEHEDDEKDTLHFGYETGSTSLTFKIFGPSQIGAYETPMDLR